MRQIVSQLLVVTVLAILFAACKEDPNAATQGQSVISGIVSDATTGSPLSGASVQAQSVLAGIQSAITDANGVYRFTFTLDSTAAVSVLITKTGYRDTTLVVQIQSGVSVPLNIQLNPRSPLVGGGGGGGGSTSGLAQTITFLGVDFREVSVYGVGGQETAVLGWEVRDSLGFAIDASHSVALNFSLNGALNGGEYLSPTRVTTNALGRAYHTFNAGIKAGAVQVVATASVTVGGVTRVMTSSPVQIVIHAGFADQAHFSLAPEKYNFPVLGLFVNKRDIITALVGDVYANPVARNTAVYFTSRAGVIQAQGFTNTDGLASADLISGNPAPVGSNSLTPFGPGFHYLKVNTVGQGGTIVVDSLLMLWSGGTIISNVAPTTFTIPNGGSQVFTFRVADANGNPLGGGTAVRVTALVPPPPDPNTPVNQVQLEFGDQGVIVLPDTKSRGAGLTDFRFVLSDGTTNLDRVTPVTVSIRIDSPNGNTVTTIGGTTN